MPLPSRKIARLPLLLLATTLFLQSFDVAHASGNLGVAVQVLPAPGVSTSSSDTHSTNLTFLLKPGESASRVLQVQNTGNVAGNFSLRLAYSHLVNGIPVFDDRKESEIAPWFSLSSETLRIAAGASEKTTVKLSVPTGTPIGIHEGTIFITADPVNATSATKGAQASIKSNVRIALSFFLGIGDTKQIVTLFSINRVRETFIKGVPFLDVSIENTGKVPIAPSGSITLSDPKHVFSVGAPIDFNSGTIEPGATSDVLIPIPASIPDGDWSALTTVSQGAVQQFRETEVRFYKIAPKNYMGMIIKILIGLLSLLLIIAGVIISRRRMKTVSPKEATQQLSTSTADFDFEAILAELEARTTQKRAAKKTVAKKAVAKKAVAKKVVAKKAVAKKAVAKKTAAKKAPAKKKAPVKKAGAKKKIAKKAPAKKR